MQNIVKKFSSFTVLWNNDDKSAVHKDVSGMPYSFSEVFLLINPYGRLCRWTGVTAGYYRNLGNSKL